MVGGGAGVLRSVAGGHWVAGSSLCGHCDAPRSLPVSGGLRARGIDTANLDGTKAEELHAPARQPGRKPRRLPVVPSPQIVVTRRFNELRNDPHITTKETSTMWTQRVDVDCLASLLAAA